MPLRKWLSAQPSASEPAQSPARLSPHSQSYTAPSSRPASFHSGPPTPGPHRSGASSPAPAFPQPQLYRATSHQNIASMGHNTQSSSGGNYSHYSSFSDDHAMYNHNRGIGLNRNESVFSFDTEYGAELDQEFEQPQTVLQREIAAKELQEDGVKLFQEGRLPPDQEQWHKLIPPEAIDVLGKKVVQRQSILFEILQSERDYVRDLALIEEIFIFPLLEFQPPVMAPNRLNDFVLQVFNNVAELRTLHEPLLGGLFARQREQHPLIQGIGDIVLDTALKLQHAYERYVKHYPIAEAAHRTELQRNPKYADFISQQSDDPRAKRRDLITFLSRPVTRLPRFNLLLETLKKHTDEVLSSERDSIDLIVGTTGEFLKSLQPGIEVANRKVEFYTLTEQLVFRRGEAIDMDLYSDHRSLIFSGELARRKRAELELRSWADVHVALLDNYFIQTQVDDRGSRRRHMVISRPIPLDYLRLADSFPPPEMRDERSFRERLRDVAAVKMFAFTVYHDAAPIAQRYTLYATSEVKRDEWVAKLKDALGLRAAQVDANRFFATNTINRGIFCARTPITVSNDRRFTGQITSAAAFSSANRPMLIVACPTGLFVGQRNDSSSFRQIMGTRNVTAIAALDGYNKAFIMVEGSLYAYSLDLMVRVATGQSPPQALEASQEKLSPRSGTVQFFRIGFAFDKALVVYCVKTLLNTYLNCLEVISPREPINPLRPRPSAGLTASFRELGTTLYVPRDAYDVTFLSKSLAIANERGITIINPMNPQTLVTVPDMDVPKDDPMMKNPVYSNALSLLKPRVETARALGIVPIGNGDLLVIFTEFGVWITKHGYPAHGARFVRWEIVVGAYTHRGEHILLFSVLPSSSSSSSTGLVPGEWVEVRHVHTGQLRQVLSAKDVRLAQSGSRTTQGPVLMAMREVGVSEREHGAQDALIEIIETQALTGRPSPTARPEDLAQLWQEFGI
ncbi:hypothetical protein BKA62DRAFT_765930 [Auriculariales sp. MPI-PUGE-AT-0066]|nr:hypothetical protein BKA62DRAFT_765930 [Auriculariales sp. MPI-PUGE-AT-0066]